MHYLLLLGRCLSTLDFCLLFACCRSLCFLVVRMLVGRCLSIVACCLLIAVCSLLLVMRCLLLVGRCSLTGA